jgi:hypothetical protein
MNRRTIAVSLSALCALASSAILAQGAAAISGTTLFTCTSTASIKDFSDAHCKTRATPPSNFGHTEIAQDSVTTLEATNETTGGTFENAELKATIAGIPLTLVAPKVHLSGSVTNRLDAFSGEHYFDGPVTLTFTEVGLAGGLANKCDVYTHSALGQGEKGVLHSEELTLTSKQQGHFVTLQPIGAAFMTFTLVNKPPETCPLAGTWTANGSIRGVPQGTTLNFSHTETTAAGTFTIGGQKAGLKATLTLKNGASGTGLSPTTVETP